MSEESTAVCCRWCHREESTAWLLSNNHGGEHGIHWGICVAMSLTRNHVAYHRDRLVLGATSPADRRDGRRLTYVESAHEWRFADGTPVSRANVHHVDYHARHPLSPRGREAEWDQLAREVEHATEVWPEGSDKSFLDEPRRMLAQHAAAVAAPDHAAVPETAEPSLW